MAQVLSIKRGTATVLDLLSGDLRVRVDGWETSSVVGEGDPVWDTFDLVGRASTEAALGSAVYNLQDLLADARMRATNISRDEQHWLHYKSEGGTEARTLILDGQLTLQANPGSGGLGPLLNSDGYVYATLAIEHMPWWEGLTPGTASNTSGISLLGGVWAPGTALTSGDLPGRIQEITFTDIGTITYLGDLWCGIRPTYGGTAGFTAFWDAKSGIAGVGSGMTAGQAADTGATGGTAVNFEFGTASAMEYCWRFDVKDFSGSANLDDWAGKYLVIGRLRCGTSGTAGSADEYLINLYHGLAPGNNPGTPPAEMVGETKISNSAYQLIELGQVQFPPFGMRVLEGYTNYGVHSSSIYIHAQHLSGTNYLWLDSVILMPCEHMVTFKKLAVNSASDRVIFRGGADGKYVGISYDTTSDDGGLAEYSATNMFYPPDGGIVVLAGQSGEGIGTSLLGGTIDVASLVVYPRYSLMRLT